MYEGVMLRQQQFFYGQLQDKHAITAARAAGEVRGKPGRAKIASFGVIAVPERTT